MTQKHLTYDEMVKQGSYYTKTSLVDIVFKLVQKEIKNIDHIKNPRSDKSKKFLDLIKK